MTDTNDYHRFFLDGDRHVGDYEGMYKNCPDPWRIEELGFRTDMRAALLLADLVPQKRLRVLDAGCGAGLFSGRVAGMLSETRPGSSMVLSDISPEAIKLSKKRFRISPPGPKVSLSFLPFDLRRIDSPECPFPGASFDLVILAQVLWGILGNLEGVFTGVRDKTAPAGHLLMSQHFPAVRKYGADIGPESLLRLAEKSGFRPVHTLETDRDTNHHWAALWTCA